MRRHTIKQVYRREFSSALNSLQKTMPPEKSVEMSVKLIMNEMKQMCRLDSNCILRDTDKALRDFSWEAVWNELASKVPTLLHLYRLLFCGAPKSLICFAVSLIIKWRSPKMGLVQRVISTLMYGNGVSKQVSATTLYLFLSSSVFFVGI